MRLNPIFILAVCLVFHTMPVDAGQSALRSLSPREREGKRIYLRGESNSGNPIHAWLGNPPMKVSAKMLPCMNCHGLDGRGKPEGGVYPSNLNWSMLTKRYGLTHPSGRKHRAYDEETLKRAITRGIDPSGNKLGSSMPQFSMSKDDLSSLVAYLKRIEDDRDPGVEDTHITLATVLPLSGPVGRLGHAVKEVLEAVFDDMNASGGIYNRKIDLRIIQAGRTPAESIDQLRHVLDNEGIFALVAPYVPEAEDQLIELAEEREIPVIGSLGTPPDGVNSSIRYIFYLLSGVSVQTRALVDSILVESERAGPPRAGLLVRSGAPYTSLARTIEDQCRRRQIPLTLLPAYSPLTFSPEPLAEEIGQQDVLFFIGPATDCTRLLAHAASRDHAPSVYQLGSFLEKEIFDCPNQFQDKLFAVFPNSKTPRTIEASRAFRAFLSRHDIAASSSTALTTAYCAGQLLIESLQDAGRQPRREQLIHDLEGLYKHETGLTPPLTFGPNRRIGAYGAYLVSIDLDTKAIVCKDRWITPRE